MRSWPDLGPVLGSISLVLYRFLYYFVEIDVFKKSCFDTRLGAILGRFGWPKGSSWEALEGQVGGKKVSRFHLGRS